MPSPPSPPARRRARSKPFSSPSAMSTSTTSGRSALTWRRASAVLDAVPATTTPSRASRRRAVSTKALLSSTSRQRTRQVWQQGRCRHIAGSRNSPGGGVLVIRSRSIPPSCARVVLSHGPARQHFDLGQLGVQLAYLVLTPDGRAEPVMGDRRHHKKPGLDGVDPPSSQSVRSISASCLQPPGTGSGPRGDMLACGVTPARQSHKNRVTQRPRPGIAASAHRPVVLALIPVYRLAGRPDGPRGRQG